MTSRHYDVVVLGRSVGALATAALLARRDFRVLVLGQGHAPPVYRIEGHDLCRRTFTMLSATSPSFRRVLQELAQTQRFRRLTEPLDPMFAVLLPEHRMEVAPDVERFAREIEREFPEIRPLVDELYSTFAEVNAAADHAFERDAVWPPGSFWERVETGRVAGALPLTEAGPGALLAKFPHGHPFRQIVELPATFATNLDTATRELPAFALARLHGAWTRGIYALRAGERELANFLIDRIEAFGGVCRFRGRATSIIVERGRVRGVIEDNEESITGAEHVVTCFNGESLAALSGGEGLTRGARETWPQLTATKGRFVVSLVVDEAGLPAPLPTESFLVPSAPDPRRPPVHLQKVDLTRVPIEPSGASDASSARDQQVDSTDEKPSTRLLVAEMLYPMGGALTLTEARTAVLTTLREHLPFLDEHLVVVDSVHDGLPAWIYESAGPRKASVRREIDRIHLKDAQAGPEQMEWLWSLEPEGFLGIGGEPVRGPIPGTYLTGPTVLPGLGQEGELLAAWSVCRLITKRDRKRQKMRRQMWTKIETG